MGDDGATMDPRTEETPVPREMPAPPAHEDPTGRSAPTPRGPSNGNGAARTSMSAAVISVRPDFRDRLAEAFLLETGSTIGMTVDEPFTSITDAHLDRLRTLDPDIVFVDLETDPEVGLRFAQFLVESALGKAVVGAGSAQSPELLLQAMEAGILEFLPTPLDSDRVSALLERLRRKTGNAVAAEAPAHLGRLLSVFSPKGGAGCTTFAVNLAVAIHQLSRKRTLIVDLDLELGETALLLGMEPRFSSMDLLENYHRVDEGLLASYIARHETGVELLSAPYHPADPHGIDAERVGRILHFLRGLYDYVVIDTPKTLNTLTLNAFGLSERLYVLATPDLQSLRNVTRAMPVLDEIAENRPEDWLHLLVNRHDPARSLPVSEVERTLGRKVRGTLRNEYDLVSASINGGKPEAAGGKSGYAKDIRSVASEVTGVHPPARKGPRILSRLSSFLRAGASAKP